MAPLRFSLAAPCCQNQECRAPPSEKPLSACSRCRVVLYCSRECQKRDVAAHKNNCVRAKQCYDLLAKEEAALRAMEPSELLPENVFETGVGDFYAIVPTRPYMLAKYELIRTMTGLPSCGAFERGLAECMDSLRLCRGDNLGVRGVVPTLLASLDRLQEAYDFIKWYETVPDDYNWGDPEAPFLTTKNAPMTESTEGFERCMSPFFLSTLTYIKFSVALMVVEVMSSLDNGGDPSRIVELSDGLRAALFPTGDVQPVTYADLAKLHEKMIQQSMELFVFTHRRNLWFWVYVLDPEKLAAEPEPPYHSLESKFYVKPWILANALLWMEFEDFITTGLNKLRQSGIPCPNLKGEVSRWYVAEAPRLVGRVKNASPLECQSNRNGVAVRLLFSSCATASVFFLFLGRTWRRFHDDLRRVSHTSQLALPHLARMADSFFVEEHEIVLIG